MKTKNSLTISAKFDRPVLGDAQGKCMDVLILLAKSLSAPEYETDRVTLTPHSIEVTVRPRAKRTSEKRKYTRSEELAPPKRKYVRKSK